MAHGSKQRCLQCVIAGVRACSHYVLNTEAADNVPCTVESREPGKFRRRARIGIGIYGVRQPLRCSAHITGASVQVSEFALKARSPRVERSVSEIGVYCSQTEIANDMPRRKRCQILLIPIDIELANMIELVSLHLPAMP